MKLNKPHPIKEMKYLSRFCLPIYQSVNTATVSPPCMQVFEPGMSHSLQELQRDIEKHSTGVASVLNLCEVLLHDCDACATDAECDSIQQATRNLDRRWRNICAMSMERRLK